MLNAIIRRRHSAVYLFIIGIYLLWVRFQFIHISYELFLFHRFDETKRGIKFRNIYCLDNGRRAESEVS